MPTLSKTKKPEADKLYVCWQGFAGDQFACPRGTRLRGDHPLVRKFFERFVEDGTPEWEWPHETGGLG